MNYTELTTLISETIDSEDATFVANIPEFIKRAEDDIFGKVQIYDLRKGAVASLIPSDAYLSLPSDFLSVYSLAIIDDENVFTFLLNKETEFLREAFSDPNVEDQPRFYTLWDDEFILLAPTPDEVYNVELRYFYKPTSIVDVDDSWLGENQPNALLYGSLLEAYRFIKGEPDLIAETQKGYDAAIANLQQLTEGRNRKDTYRTADHRVPT